MRNVLRKLAFALGIYFAVWIGIYVFFLITFRLGPDENEVADRLDFTFTNLFPHLIDAWTFGESAGGILVWFFSLALFWPCLAVVWTICFFRSSNRRTFTLRPICLRQLVPLWLVSVMGFGGFCLYFKIGNPRDFALHLNAAVESPVIWRDLMIGKIRLGDSGEKLRENYDLKRIEIVEGADLYEAVPSSWFGGLFLMTSNDKIVWAGTGDDTWDISFFEDKSAVEAIDQKFATRYEMAKKHVELLAPRLTRISRFSFVEVSNARKAGDIQVSGEMASDEGLADLKELIIQSNPPFGIEWRVTTIDPEVFELNLKIKENIQSVSDLLSGYDVYVSSSPKYLGDVTVFTITDDEVELAPMKELIKAGNLSFEVIWETTPEAKALLEYRKELSKKMEE